MYLESYTSIFLKDQREEDLLSLPIEFVESNSDEILANVDKEDVAFLVVGDPLG